MDDIFKVLLVDDEKFIRKSLLNRIDWAALGLFVAAEAENGMEALSLIEKIRPQIVFVDIRMPLMDGLTFIQEAKIHYPEIHYVITSAYDDFEYARQAIGLGVTDYILKPVKVFDVEQLLKKIVHKLTEERISRRLKERGKPEDTSAEPSQRLVAALAFYVEDVERLESDIRSGLRKAFAADSQIEIYKLKEYSCEDCYLYMLSGKQLEEAMIFEAAAQVWSVLDGKEGCAAWSEVLPGNEMKTAAGRCIRLLKGKLFYPERKMLAGTALGKEHEMREEENLNQIHRILNGVYRQIPKGNFNVIKGELMQLPDLIVNRNNRIPVIEKCIRELVVLLESIIQQELDQLETDIIFHLVREKDYLLHYRTEKELKDTLAEMILYACESQSRGEKKDLITGIKEYIRNNYSEELSAADIAGIFFLNTTYLSTLFKEKTGMTMTAYIEAVRMERARQMLLNRELSITEVAGCTGYSDPNYFTKVFRKYTNMSPRRYREEMGKFGSSFQTTH